jgi:hypothetical protein
MDMLKELIRWAGLISWIGAGLCLSVVGLRHAKGLAISFSSLGKELEPIDRKFAKAAGILLLTGIVLFVVADMVLNRQ